MALKGTWRIVAGLLCFWLVVLLYMSTTLYQTSEVSERSERQLAKALAELDALKLQNDQLQKLANELKDIKLTALRVGGNDEKLVQNLQKSLDDANFKLKNIGQEEAFQEESLTGDEGPSLEHESLRRKTENGVKEMWFYLRSQFKHLSKSISDSTLQTKIEHIIEDGADHQRTVMNDLYNLSLSNGAASWRIKEAKELGDIVQSRLKYLQNPDDCNKAKKVVCNLNKGCGYGCQIHHIVYCLIIAYGTERTLVLESKGWRYSSGGWEKVFLPLSETCTDRYGKSSRSWGPPNAIESAQVIDLPIVDSLHPRPQYMPLSIPEDLAPRLLRLHGNPSVWWIGQILKYMLRPQPWLEKDLTDTYERLGFSKPIVGVHVRRTDKVGTEAAFHGIEEYMAHVDEYYTMLEMRQKVYKRRIYLATDDPNLLKEARSKYTNYEIISDNGFSVSAGLGQRYTDESLRGIIMDIHFLSLTDHLVCTFSSQVCRVAYEIMQTLHPDASAYFYSLDDIFYYGGQNAHNQEVIAPHKKRDAEEIDLEMGDIIGIAGNHWDGYSKGVNKRTGKVGLYPSYKVREFIDIVQLPAYSKADKFREGRS